jgi:metal-responsive CopG/Arc/MetJ family transcriptional regulator
MSPTRINLGLSATMLRDLDRLAARYGFDRTNAIRYCIRVVCDDELRIRTKARKDEDEPHVT